MPRADEKGRLYEILIARIDETIEREYFLESTWLSYSAIEDRAISILEKSNIAITDKMMMGRKLSLIEKEIKENKLISNFLEQDMIDRLRSWIDVRNALMHEMANGEKTWQEIQSETAPMARDGRNLVRELAAIAMRFKKAVAKTSP